MSAITLKAGAVPNLIGYCVRRRDFIKANAGLAVVLACAAISKNPEEEALYLGVSLRYVCS